MAISVIVSSSSTVATAGGGTHGRFLFLSQVGELQKQIDELRRQIETLPPGPSKTRVTDYHCHGRYP